MTVKTPKRIMAGLLILASSLIAQSAKAVPITEIGIPMLGTTYDTSDHTFKISGLSDVQVFYDGSPPVYYNANFILDTSGLDWMISDEGRTITYSAGNPGTGAIDLRDADAGFSPLFTGSLTSLEMTIVDPVLGLFQGTGNFWVIDGTLADDFGNNGGLGTAGIAFRAPFNFNNERK